MDAMAKRKKYQKEYSRNYYLKNRDTLLKYAKEYYDKHKSDILSKNKVEVKTTRVNTKPKVETAAIVMSTPPTQVKKLNVNIKVDTTIQVSPSELNFFLEKLSVFLGDYSITVNF
jgi:hypothetical protein